MLVCESQVEKAKTNGSTSSPRGRFSVVTCQPFHLHWFNLYVLHQHHTQNFKSANSLVLFALCVANLMQSII
jgi:hypothetical protein